ncbi:branched-chain amino acid transporter permease [Fluviispira multicolorata]|uniref:Branched-chain amino acid transport protein AzlD n=1 Tax=Fluviispira multicolorata TaxID=2654512 RepID=A0A833JBY7_9BACT|nr:AzlD domain-containing protein [Fluviispira multicolorata]KAB8029828.1 hypothetical protein GCL57_09825 [Fluviispira multicolorata]
MFLDNNLYIIYAIIIMSVVTYLTRIIPFAFFQYLNNPILRQTGKQLPVCLMAILTLYSIDSLKDFDNHYFINGWIACLVTIGLYLGLKSILTSMVIGTIVYYLLLNKIIAF